MTPIPPWIRLIFHQISNRAYYLCLQMMARMTMNTMQMEIVTNSTRKADI